MYKFIEVDNLIFNTDRIIYVDEPYEIDQDNVNNKWKISIHYECTNAESGKFPKYSWTFKGDAGKSKAWAIHTEIKNKLVPESDPKFLTQQYKEKI
jgi:hypothetical protein